MAQAGRFKEPIYIYDVTKTRNQFGEQVDEMTLVYQTRANVIYTGGYRGVINNEIQTPYTKSFIIRIYVPITDTSWIKWNDQFWRVTNIELSKERQEITVTTTLVND